MAIYTTQTNGTRTFSGEVEPQQEILILDIYEIQATPKAPKEIDKYLFKIMSEATNQESDIFKL